MSPRRTFQSWGGVEVTLAEELARGVIRESPALDHCAGSDVRNRVSSCELVDVERAAVATQPAADRSRGHATSPYKEHEQQEDRGRRDEQHPRRDRIGDDLARHVQARV